ETEIGARWFEFLHIALAMEQVAIEALENLESGFAIDGAEIGARFRRPDDGDTFRFGRSFFRAHFFKPNSRRTSSWGMPSPRSSDARARSRAAAVSGVISSPSMPAWARERESGSTIT